MYSYHFIKSLLLCRMPSRFVFRWLLQILLVVGFMSLLFLMYSQRAGSEQLHQQEILKRKEEIKEQIRLQKLHDLQKTIFKNPQRPPDAKYNLNVTLSERTPLERPIPDTRPKLCRQIRYDISKLPTISIIMPIYNEALSMLLRTCHSILLRTPERLLADIILVDDHSTHEDLGEPLESYVKLLPKVKIVRTTKREGLIRARLIGANMATGEVLMFQDAHMENNVQWAEPLLEEIRKNRRTVIQPQVDDIGQWSIEYRSTSGKVPRGGFTWDLRYVWMQMPDHERNRLRTEADPHRTATLVGCALAVDKEYFISIGGFDDGMNIWGGENIELGFRNWMCGGQVLTHPCSRVAHTFKPFPYKFDGDREKIVQKNQMRIAELWMGEYKKFFLAATYSWPNKRVTFNQDDMESLEKRKQLRESLKCKSFEWFLSNIIPEMSTPPSNAVYHGEIANLRTEACWYLHSDGRYIGITYVCFFHRVLPENVFSINTKKQMTYRRKCVCVDEERWLLMLCDCEDAGSLEWSTVPLSEKRGIPYEIMIKVSFSSGLLAGKSFCVSQVTNVHEPHHKEQMPQLAECDIKDKFQHWRFTYKFDFNYDFGLFA